MMLNEHERHHKRKTKKKHNSPLQHSALFLLRARPPPASRQSQLSLGCDRLIGWLISLLGHLYGLCVHVAIAYCSARTTYAALQQRYPMSDSRSGGDCFEL